MTIDVYTEKAQYLINESVSLNIDFINCYKPNVECEISVFELNQKIRVIKATLHDEKNIIDIGKYEAGLKGYGVFAACVDQDGSILHASTAFDMENKPQDSIRYGFLSDFTKEDGTSDYDIENLKKYHINYLQYYDWSYRHDHLVSPDEEYIDMMGKKICKETIRHKIKLGEKYGMYSLGYGAVYAASKEFYEHHKDWAFYNSAGEVVKFIDIFYIMNISSTSQWHHYIISQYQKAVSDMGFSGIHMDTYGFPKTAYSMLHDKRELVLLEQEFPGLITDTYAKIKEEVKEPVLIFNNVGNWPVTTVADTEQAAIYIEVWKPYEKYYHIKQIIRDAKKANKRNKPIILAAYLAPFRMEDDIKAGYGAYILTAAIASNGAYHLLLGEEDAVLTQGYYSDYSKLNSNQAQILRKYYDFIIQYMALMYAPDCVDVTMTHMGGDNYEYQCLFDNWNVDGNADKIWVTITESRKYQCIYLVNLCGCQDDYWNKGKECPEIQYKKSFRVHIDGEIAGVFVASPDADLGMSIEITYQEFVNDKGKFIEFTVDKIEIWSLIYIERK